MASVYVDSLIKSFAFVPPAAIPAIVDCVLASSTTLSASQLFSQLLDTLPCILQDGWNSDSSQPMKIVSFVAALFHLVKRITETGSDMLSLLIWKGLIPIFKMSSVDDKELLTQIEEMMREAILHRKSWKLMEETLVLFCLRSIGIYIGMTQSEEDFVFHWKRESPICCREYELDDSISVPLPVACHILVSLLDTSLQANSSWKVNGNDDIGFSLKLIWDLSFLVIHMLSQCTEHRSCAIRYLLPAIFKALTYIYNFNVQVLGSFYALSWFSFSRKIWKCCSSLFALGSLERHDAYTILSLCLNSPIDAKENRDLTDEMFDIRSEDFFWEEIRKGLVDNDAMVRKLSLHIVKLCLRNEGILHDREASQFRTSSFVYNGIVDITSKNVFGETRQGKWAKEESKPLDVGEIDNFSDHWNGLQRWKAFILLYEMLEEYGTHLVEAAWTNQVRLLFQSGPCKNNIDPVGRYGYEIQMETVNGMLNWLTVLWERGFVHENSQVRCLIMQSFLNINWETHGSYAKQIPEKFILGPLIQGLNDVAHHKDFGLKGAYSSKTIQDASNFFLQSCGNFDKRTRIRFLYGLASVARQEPFIRAGLMALAFCLSSAARGATVSEGNKSNNTSCYERNINIIDKVYCLNHDASELLDALGIIIERCKQHFNPKYRLQVCEQIMFTAYFALDPCDVPLDVLLHFLSTIPWEFINFSSPLRRKIQGWFSRIKTNDGSDSEVMRNIYNFPIKFVKHQHVLHNPVSFDDEDLNAWVFETQRWVRIFFLTLTDTDQLEHLLMFLKDCGTDICKSSTDLDWLPVKFLIIITGLIEELQYIGKNSSYFYRVKSIDQNEVESNGMLGQLSQEEVSSVYEKFQSIFLSFVDELLKFVKSASATFWYFPIVKDTTLPSSIGRLGGPCQRRLPSFTTTSVLQAIISLKSIVSIFCWFTLIEEKSMHSSIFTFLWNFSSKVICSPSYDTETGSEICLAAFEALVPVFRAFSFDFSLVFDFIRTHNKLLYPNMEDGSLLDPLLLNFLRSINGLLINGILTRSRRAILMNWKWLCIDSLVSIPYNMTAHGGHDLKSLALFSDSCLKTTFFDIVESLENASESSALPMLRSVRLILGLFDSQLNSQTVYQLVHSSWILHVSCNKRRVAPIAALLSSILHPSLFCDPSMHQIDGGMKGPLQWFIEQLINEGTKSPRTIRLAACHLTGLWSLYPGTIKYYIKELKLLSLHGSVAFDEDFEAELSENFEAKTEVLMLAQNPYSEFAEAFINTEMYARVSVAILFHKLSKLNYEVQEGELIADMIAACHSGRMFLLELLDSVVNDTDLAKELYKKYSAVHRRKVRAWQMLCVLSHYVDDNILEKVTYMLHICLYRGNMPSVRQYIEIFCIQTYLKFPTLIQKQLVPILRDYNMRPQALSSYVFISANLILHASEVSMQLSHLNDLLPPIIPLLTSHHHSLRGFAQVLVYTVLSKLVPIIDSSDLSILPLEKKCFLDLKSYLAENIECVRLRASMDFFFDFDPNVITTPAGIFNARNEAYDFECVAMSLMEQVNVFLNDVREDLRYSMANDTITLKNESFKANGNCRKMDVFQNGILESGVTEVQNYSSTDFQKKITFNKHERQPLNVDTNCYSGIAEFPRSLIEMEKEDLLLGNLAHSRCIEMEKLKESRQQFILVASLLDRIPNLAGLARTCEIFQASALVVADASVVKDKQFQLISVTAEKWVPIMEVPVGSLEVFLGKKKHEGFSIIGLEQTANSTPLDRYSFPTKTVLVLGREKEGIPVDIIHALDACVEIPQFGIIRSLNVHVSGAIAFWEYTRQQRGKSI